MDYLIVIDMQNDFIDGSLGTREAEAIYPKVLNKVNNFNGTIWFTKDTHPNNYLELQEGEMLPVEHCIKDSFGWQFPKELEELRIKKNGKVYYKPSFGSVEMAQDLKKDYDKGLVDSVELIGLCTDICVISNALLIKAYMPELKIYVDAKACAGVTPLKHNAALETMKSCQIIVNDKYNFYGYRNANATPINEDYKKIKSPKDLYDILENIWEEDTCAPRMRESWSKDNKTLGQCSITAFLVQDIFGGEVRGILRPKGNYHCFNVIDGKAFDLTSEQFKDELLDFSINKIQSREEHFSKKEKYERYLLLKQRLNEYLKTV